jgi:trehalose 6-phosphate phosphatase
LASPDPLPVLLAPFRDHAATAGIVTDFDGTIAPIVLDPPDARPLPGSVEVLHQLAGRYGRVAVVSGRPAAFLAQHLELAACPQLVAYGLYGLEWTDGERILEHPDAEQWRPAVTAAADAAEAEAPEDVWIERKGLSVTLHVRVAPERDHWAAVWAAQHAALTGLAVHPARMSYELRPPIAVDKGTVLHEILGDLAAACFIGDDLGDLPAYDALDVLAGTGLTALRVGVRSPEAPEELLARADVKLDGPAAVLEFLRELL